MGISKGGKKDPGALKRRLTLPAPSPSIIEHRRFETTWSLQRDRHRAEEKTAMARHFVSHDFLVGEGMSPDTDLREPVASIVVNQGTTPNTIVREALNWIANNPDLGPFNITWYTPGALIPATLRDIREEVQHMNLRQATNLFLFPGLIDPLTEAVSGAEAAQFIKNMTRQFTYALLSANSFDIMSGNALFHLSEEVRIQRACATRIAAQKFLFLDSTKFKREGEIGYNIYDLLITSNAITVYTTSSSKDDWLQRRFKDLCDALFEKASYVNDYSDDREKKQLRLQIVGNTRNSSSSSIIRAGVLRRLSA